MSDRKPEPLKEYWIGLLGFAVLASAAGLILLTRYLSGSWDATVKWVVGMILSVVALAVMAIVSFAIGYKLWYGALDQDVEGRGGLSKMRIERIEHKEEKARAREAARQQDGQVSVVSEKHGRVSIAGSGSRG